MKSFLLSVVLATAFMAAPAFANLGTAPAQGVQSDW